MSLAQRRSGKGIISELALARAQRNTVVIVDDLFSSRLLLAEIVRQIDGKLNLELFDTPSRALEFCRTNRADMILTDYKLPEFDGAIMPPRDLRSVLELPRLVESMLRRRWKPERIQKILGQNFLRVLGELRP